MLAIAVLATVLVVEAYRAAREHRATARQVLTDYASLGAQGSAARLQSDLAPRLFPVLTVLRESPSALPASLAEVVPPRSASVARAARWTGRLGREGDPSTAADPGVVPLRGTLLDTLHAISKSLPDEAYFAMHHSEEGWLVFTPWRTGAGAVGFLLPDSAFLSLAQQVVAQVMILPPAITKGESLEDGLGVELRFGDEVLAQRGYAGPTPFMAKEDFGPMFGGLGARVRIAEALAPRLVIGGLPKSRVPVLTGVLVLTLVLATAGMVQVRQERRLVQLREDVVAGASHELRTPLAQIRLFAETLRLGRVRSEEERDRALAVIEREALRLEHLVDNLLHTSRSERGSIHLVREHLDLTALTRQIVDDFAPLASKAGVSVVVHAPEPVMLAVDPAAWRQVMVNLLDNAIKYGGHSAPVRVAIHGEADRAVVTVRDEGPGISLGDSTRVWDRFWRGSAAQGSGATGSGLGLATVRDLVGLHGGDCAVVDAGTPGATIRIEVPR